MAGIYPRLSFFSTMKGAEGEESGLESYNDRIGIEPDQYGLIIRALNAS
jgi:hypothetical protein